MVPRSDQSLYNVYKSGFIPRYTLIHSESADFVVACIGIFRELKRVIPPDAYLYYPDTEIVNAKPTWILIGYKSLDQKLDPALESCWKDWTGARHLYLNLRPQFVVNRISFFVRESGRQSVDLFSYVVLIKVDNVHSDKNLVYLIDLIEKTKMERGKGYLSVYVQEEEDTFHSVNENRNIKFSSSEKESAPNISSHTLTAIANDNVEINSSLIVIEQLLREIKNACPVFGIGAD